MTLIVPEHCARRQHAEDRRALIAHFNKEMEKTINANSHKNKFYIIGCVRFPQELGGKIGKVFLETSDAKPPLVKSTFVYEVDNREGTKELLWTCDNQRLKVIPTNKEYLVSPT